MSLVSQTGLPEDAAMNVWHFNTAESDVVAQADQIEIALDVFYSAISSIYSANTITGVINTKYFDLLDVPPRVPILESSITIGSLGTGDALPTECAITMSYQALPESGINQRRRRGRLFLGPLDGGVASTAAGVVKIGTAVLETIAAAALALQETGSVLDWQWIVFSPTTAGAPPWTLGELNSASALVDNGWVDNAFDTQRRRGTRSDARELWSA